MKTRYIIFIVGLAFILSYLLIRIYILNPGEEDYKKTQSNQEHNISLIQNNGGFLGVCIRLAINDIEKEGAKPNDFRIISYHYDQELVTIPHDTSDRFYSFKVFYTRQDSVKLAMRVAAYKINFKEQFKRIYDVLAIDEKAREQLNEKK